MRVLLAGGGHSHIEVLRRFAGWRDAHLEVTLVSPEPTLTYTGMAPGVVAGHYRLDQTQIDLVALAARAGAGVVRASVVGIDLATREVTTDRGAPLAFDLLSLDIGATPATDVAGAAAHALAAKPLSAFLRAWERIAVEAAHGVVASIAVVGGGAGGVELTLAMHHRLRAQGVSGVRFTLVTATREILPELNAVARARFAQELAQRGVDVITGATVTEVLAGAILAGHQRMAADRVIWTTGAAAAPWLAGSGLACDERGFVRIDRHLRSTSHPCVFAAGDCASQAGHPRPKSGVYAVRQGPPLAANLRRAAHGSSLRTYQPQPDALALVSTGERHAIGARGPFAVEGDWVWRWKDRVDRRFVAKYAS